MSVPENIQPCRRCGMPGAVLHFPGGYLCQGGCDPNPIMKPIEPEITDEDVYRAAFKKTAEELTTLRTRLQQVEIERDKAEADAAVKHAALEKTFEWYRGQHEYAVDFLEDIEGQIVEALSTNAGKSLLLRLRELTEWIRETERRVAPLNIPDDMKARRESLLK